MILNEKIIKDELKKVLIEVKDLIEKGEFEFQSRGKRSDFLEIWNYSF